MEIVNDYAFTSPIYLALVVLYFLSAAIVTFDVRLNQAKMHGENFGTLPAGIIVFYWLQWIIFIALVFLNWKFAVAIFAVKFVLKVLPVLEMVGNIICSPLKTKT